LADYVDVILRLLQARQFESDASKASKAIGGVGTAAEKSGKQAGISWKSVAKWGGGAAAIYGATRFMKGAMQTTEDLGKSTLALNRTTGMSIKTSSEWAAVLKTRNLNTTGFQRGMVVLSKQMVKSTTDQAKYGTAVKGLNQQLIDVERQGGKGAATQMMSISKQLTAQKGHAADAVKIWRQLGVSMDDVRKGNVQQVLLEVSDGLSKMKNPAERAVLTQKLFSRSGLDLAPVLYKGSAAIKDQLNMANKYGLAMSGKNAKAIQKSIADQREMKMAYMGVQVSLGKALLPVMLAIEQIILKITNIMQPFIQNGYLVKGLILGLVTAFLAFKAVMIAAQIATAAETLGLTELDAAMLLNPIGLVIVAIVALVAAFVILWKKSATFRDMVYAVWHALEWAFDWAKQNWPLLVGILGGPFGLAAAYIITHWGQVKQVIFEVWNWIKKNWPLLVAILGGPFALAIEQIITHWDTLKKAVGKAIDWIIGKIKTLLHLITGIPDKLTGLAKKIPGVGTALSVAGKVGHYANPLNWFGQAGGIVPYPGGRVLVGEAGPEIIRLPPAAVVHPLPNAGAAGLAGEFTVRVPVFLDRRQIAEAVGSFTADKLARR
jgi:hypothetical protein